MHEADSYVLVNGPAPVDDASFGLYDDWDLFLASPSVNTFFLPFPAGTRDCTYGSGALNKTLGELPARLVAVGCDHTKTKMKAAYAQMGIDVFAPGVNPNPTPTPEQMPYTSWSTDYEYSCPDFGGGVDEKLFYIEYVFNGAECSAKAKECGEKCCKTGGNDLGEIIQGGLIVLGSRTYGVEQTGGLGPSLHEVVDVELYYFEQQE